MLDADAGRAAVPADVFDGSQCGGRLGLLLGLTFLAVERRKISTKKKIYVQKTTSFTSDLMVQT